MTGYSRANSKIDLRMVTLVTLVVMVADVDVDVDDADADGQRIRGFCGNRASRPR